MTSKLFLLSLVLNLLSINGISQDSAYQSLETFKAINDSEVIGIITLEKYEAKNVRSARFSQVYKGWVYQRCLVKINTTCVLSEGDYLIFARFGENRIITLDSCIYAIPLHKAKPFIEEIQRYLICKNEQERLTGACERRIEPVCGCDNIMYGNACEANRAGIMFYKFGQCY